MEVSRVRETWCHRHARTRRYRIPRIPQAALETRSRSRPYYEVPFFPCVTVRFYLTPVAVGLAIFRGPCTRRLNSSAPCSTHGRSRRSVGGSTLVQETASQKPSGRPWLLQNKVEYSLYCALISYRRSCVCITSAAHIWISHQLCGVHHFSLHLGFVSSWLSPSASWVRH